MGVGLAELALPSHEEGLAELRVLAAPLGDREVPSPADTCPDIADVGTDGVHLLDFECVRRALRAREARLHPAWDVACLLPPWPTC